MQYLNKILNILNNKKSEFKNKKISYSIPSLWLDSNLKPGTIDVNPIDFFSDKINFILNNKLNNNGEYTYNMFIRATLSFNHNLNSNLKNFDKDLFKNQGTFLKAIAFLPYLIDLGASQIHILPVNTIGEDGKKGNLGSPYAIKNHYKIDANLAENILDELTADEQYKAFIEACHLCNIKVIQEFVFRIASIDSDLTLTNPNWFYWLKNSVKIANEENQNGYSAPKFSTKHLIKIKEKIEENEFKDLIPPDEKYRSQFTKSPIKVARVDGKIIGLLENLPKPKKSNEVKIAPAFADWPPDDNQPAWSDVTYFKLYDHNNFNYIAYNTVRMYDLKLAQKTNKNQELWDYLSNILPYYIKEFGIDGAMIDMGHSLPTDLLEEIINKAKNEKSDFIFWEESFNLYENSAKIYDAALGYSIFDSHLPDKLFELIKRIENKDLPINFLGTPENHNTPRAMMRINNINYAKLIYLVFHILPSIKYIHSGFELLEYDPINTGLQFTDEQIKVFPSDKLPLFSYKEFNWNNENIINFIKDINKLDIPKNSMIKIERLGNNLFEINLDNKYYLIFNHSETETEIDTKENIIFSNNVSLNKNKIEINDYGFVLIMKKNI